ncbi:MAG: TolC family outer membrane protein [Gammaproteobacteria bacterium]|jgi:outer membrane protein
MNNNKSKPGAVVALLFFGSLWGFLWVSAAHAEDLLQIYQLALENDPTFKAAEATLQSTIESKGQADSNYLPSVDLSAGGSKNKTETSTTTTDSDSIRYGVSLSQAIYNRNFPIQSRLAKSYISAAEADFASATQNLIVRASDGYLGVLRALDNLEFANAEQESIGRQLEQTKQRFDVGLVAITDVHEAQARFDLARARTIEAENALNNAREALRSITGKYHDSLAVLSEKTPFVARPDPDNIDYWTETALDKNYNLLTSQQVVIQAEETVSLQRAGYFPTLYLNGSYQRTEGDDYIDSSTQRFVNGDVNNSSVSLNFNMNLYNGGSTKSAVSQARQDLRYARETYEQTKREVQRRARNEYLGVISGISRVQALKQAVVSNESALKAAEAGFEVGTRTTVDVLNARSLLFSAINNYSQARYDYISSWLRLLQAAGSLDQAALERINKWLEEK